MTILINRVGYHYYFTFREKETDSEPKDTFSKSHWVSISLVPKLTGQANTYHQFLAKSRC